MNTDNFKKEIKKVKAGHVALLCAGVFLAFAIIGTILLAAGGLFTQGFHFNQMSIGPGQIHEVNDHDEQDMAGITGITISSVSDDITILHGGEKIQSDLKGQCRSISKPVWLEVSRHGSTLEIAVKYPQGGINNSTALTVTIPDGYQGDLSLSTVSGAMHVKDMPFTLGNVTINTVSGDTDFSVTAYHDFSANTTSGDIRMEKAAAKTEISTISGDINITYEKFAQTTIGTISGDILAAIPENAAFTIEYGTVSGNFSSTHPGLGVDSADKGFHGSANGGGDLLKVNTTSGGLTLQKS